MENSTGNTTRLGYRRDEVRSGLQKAIRRGQEEKAAWWAIQMINEGWHQYLWRTLRLIASEDIGIGDPMVTVQVDALARNAEVGTNGFNGKAFVGLCEMHAIIALSRAQKCWQVTHLLLKSKKAFKECEQGSRTPPRPDPEVLDAHTEAGRAAGVPLSKWWSEGDALEPKASSHYRNGTDPFADVHGDSRAL